jgi:ankyrin repeat protein
MQDIGTVVKMGNLHLLESFIVGDRNLLNWRDDEGNTLLAIAFDNNIADPVINYLIAQIDFRETNESGISAFDIAIRRGRTQWIEKMVEMGVDVNHTERQSNFTPLMEAVTANRFEIAETLLENGADKKLRDSYGFSAVDFARKMKRAELIDLLERYS